MGRSVLGSRSSHTHNIHNKRLRTLNKSVYKTPTKKLNYITKWLKKLLSPPLPKNNWNKLSKLRPLKKLLLLNLMPVKNERPEKVRRRPKRLRNPKNLRRAKRRLPKNLERPENLKNPRRPRNPKKHDVFDDERLPRKLNELSDELPELPAKKPEVVELLLNALLLP